MCIEDFAALREEGLEEEGVELDGFLSCVDLMALPVVEAEEFGRVGEGGPGEFAL